MLCFEYGRFFFQYASAILCIWNIEELCGGIEAGDLKERGPRESRDSNFKVTLQETKADIMAMSQKAELVYTRPERTISAFVVVGNKARVLKDMEVLCKKLGISVSMPERKASGSTTLNCKSYDGRVQYIRRNEHFVLCETLTIGRIGVWQQM